MRREAVEPTCCAGARPALLRRRVAAWAEWLARYPLLAWVDLVHSALEAFVRRAAASVRSGARVLDAGAGAWCCELNDPRIPWTPPLISEFKTKILIFQNIVENYPVFVINFS